MDGAQVVRVTVRVVAVVVVAGLLLAAAFAVRQILVLVVVALFLAVGLDPFVRALARVRLARGPAVAAVLLGAVLFVGGFVASVTPPLVRQTQTFASQIPRLAEDLTERNERIRDWNERYEITERLQSAVSSLPDLVGRSAGSVLGVAGAIGRAIFSVLTVAILTVYFLLDLPKLVAGGLRLVPSPRRARAERMAQVVFERISGYMVGQLAVSAISAVSSFVVLSGLRVPYALPLAMWVGLAALIPMVGSMIGAVPAAIVAFSRSVPVGIAVVVFFVAYQQIENYVVAPRVMRRAVDISAAAVVLAALIGATLLGFVGALLAIPVAASIKVLVQELWIDAGESGAAQGTIDPARLGSRSGPPGT